MVMQSGTHILQLMDDGILFAVGEKKFEPELRLISADVEKLLLHASVDKVELVLAAREAWDALNSPTKTSITNPSTIRNIQAKEFVNALRALQQVEPENTELAHVIELSESAFCMLAQETKRRLNSFFADAEIGEGSSPINTAADAWRTFKRKSTPTTDQPQHELQIARVDMHKKFQALLNITDIPEEVKNAIRDAIKNAPIRSDIAKM